GLERAGGGGPGGDLSRRRVAGGVGGCVGCGAGGAGGGFGGERAGGAGQAVVAEPGGGATWQAVVVGVGQLRARAGGGGQLSGGGAQAVSRGQDTGFQSGGVGPLWRTDLSRPLPRPAARSRAEKNGGAGRRNWQ